MGKIWIVLILAGAARGAAQAEVPDRLPGFMDRCPQKPPKPRILSFGSAKAETATRYDVVVAGAAAAEAVRRNIPLRDVKAETLRLFEPDR